MSAEVKALWNDLTAPVSQITETGAVATVGRLQ